jgi:collagen type VI alpha
VQGFSQSPALETEMARVYLVAALLAACLSAATVQGDVSDYLTENKPVADLSVQGDDPAAGSRKADIVIVKHLSTDFSPSNIRKFFNPMMSSFFEDAEIDNGNVKVSMVNFAKRPRVRFNLNEYTSKAQILQEIDDIGRRDRAKFGNSAKALTEVRKNILKPENGDRPDVQNYVILIMDNESNADEKAIFKAAEKLKASGTKIITVGIADSNENRLKAIASEPQEENHIYIKSYRKIAGPKLIDVVKNAIPALLPPPTTTTTTTTTTPPATTQPPSTTRKPDAQVATTTLAAPAFTGAVTINPSAHIDSCWDVHIDLVFVIDASTSVSERSFRLIKGFIKDFISEARVDSGHVGVGIVIYSTEVYVQFQMNTYTDKQEIMDAVDAIPYRYGSTNTAGALKVMREEMFTEANGDRPDVDNVCIIITDGLSNINARKTIPEAEKAHDAGIHIYAIGIGLTDTYEIDAIATPPWQKNRFEVTDFNELKSIEGAVFTAICGGKIKLLS